MNLLLFVCCSQFTPCSAQTIGNWTLNNTLSGTGGTYNAAGAISLGPGIPTNAFNGGTEFFGENGWPSGALSTNAYLQFSLTPNAGYELNLSGLILRVRRSNTGSPAGAGPTQWSLRSSLDGFAADIASGSMNHNYANYPVTLTGFYNIYTTITFRVYGYTTTAGSGGISRMVFDNISVQGLVYVLPVHLSAFKAASDNKGHVVASWTAQNISAGTRFMVQRSLNGVDFVNVDELTEATETGAKNYALTDRQTPATSSTLFYRLKAIEPGGGTYLSAVAMVTRQSNLLQVSHVAVQNQSVFSVVQLPVKGTYTAIIQSGNGATIQKQLLQLGEGLQTIHLPMKGIARGVYIFSIRSANGMVSKQFVY